MAVSRWLLAAALTGGVAASVGSCWGGSTRTLYLSGQAAPAGLSFASFGRAAVNARGTVCFFAGWDSFLQRPEGLFMRHGDQVAPVIRAGDPVPGIPGERFSFPTGEPDEFTAFSLNNQDQVAFIAQQGLYLYADGAVRPLARIGDPVPGAPDETWDEVDAVSLNNAGTVAFVGAIRSTLDGDWQPGVFVISGSGVQIALFTGDQVPGLGGQLSGFSSVALNDAGQIATLAQEGEDQVNCILLTSGAGTQALAVEGASSPGGVWTELDSAAVNNAGAVAFQAREKGTAGEHGGIYLASGGSVTAVALPGQTVSGAGGGTLGDGLARPVLDDAGNVGFLGALAGSAQPRALVVAAGGQLSALAVEGQPAPAELKGTVARFSGLSLGSMVGGALVCGVDLSGSITGDAIVQYSTAGTPTVLLTTASSLPAGASLTLTDGVTPPSEIQARINRRGDVVFAADVGGYGRALFRLGADGPVLLTPLGGGVRGISAFDLNDAGQIAYLAARDEADQDQALFMTSLDHPEAAAEIAATGQPVGSGNSELIRRLGAPRIDAGGAVIFTTQGQAEGAAGTKAFLLHAGPDGRDVLAAAGQPVPGVGVLAEPPDTDPSADSNLFRELQWSRDGQLLFLSSYQDSATGSYVSNGLFLLAGGTLRAVALPGQRSPLPDGPIYSSIASPRLSDGGTVTFAAWAIGPGRKSHTALVRLSAHDSAALAIAGDLIPGPAEAGGAQFRAFLEPAVSAAGDVAFYALLDPPPTGGAGALFTTSGGALRLAMRDVDLVDAATGATVRFDNLPSLATPSLQDDGSILVAARLQGGTAPDGLFLVQP